ncbi:2-polyprenyl-6-methoxyphenol hydroxylase-like FAD-dependent oxidoreductase [Bradyrhizobium sp. R2.2-H]|jgi:2-polyprenyl-6-methoxyphenol hydroxylase-like FAD-dependent oxidoreductase|uniref:FAD-dependent monooxygenase n=1 Tax=unclassified Bradyrhizobium TaxID=2631580 RepID=UPI00104FAA5D|nr:MULTISPECIES: FAD-dependent monooxygenase [unclassified Bradyrhizobium]TCU65570.1 2-polyprenyl-6-methoxyphenol hydroxylase-like FAD-dependent oxidoreductase [Bradyrhizobium sp. Y-H1]TCU67717.1 2-polyprenyl-6-methoxyphenol hydroxylase-like FAD-dependent oxidoreductase [Bradyrhizobium sp. R2.2-H]
MPVLLPKSRSNHEAHRTSARAAASADHAVLIAGGGPTGLMLAAELALTKIDVAVIERRADQALVETRAGGLHARTLEILDQRGIADRFLREGQITQLAGFAWTRLDISDLPTRYPYGLALRQAHIERILADWATELGVAVYRDTEVSGFAQDEAGVHVTLSGGKVLRANYLVGCDGGRSVVRKAAGIDFAGFEPTLSNLMAEVEMREAPRFGLRHDALGFHGLSKTESGRVLVVVTEATLARSGEPGLRDLSGALNAVYGTDFGLQNPAWISRFTDAALQAKSYRKGRVLLAGDAAHIHHSVGGQGLNLGVQDAVNLGWKLAQVVKRISPESLLDTYHDERHPVAARVLKNTMAQIALLRRGDDGRKAAREVISELLAMDEPRHRLGAMMSGLDIRYDLGADHALLGRRMPDLDFMVDGRPLKLFTLLHGARGVLLSFGQRSSVRATPWADRIAVVDGDYDGPWQLPAIGDVAAPAAVLVRPDGHVAWVGDGSERGLAEALTAWFGPITTA